jgi:DNA polymerase I-like protein with 3'-5' exonuclease and polymerase domains
MRTDSNYSLNSLGFDYLKKVKSEALLKQAAADFGVHPKKELWKLPAMYVGEYAEQDAALTLELWQHFKIKMRQEEVESIFSLETEVFPVLMNMTQRGIRFDRTKAEQLIDRLQKREKAIYQELKSACGSGVDIWAAQSIAVAFDKLGVAYGKTENGTAQLHQAILRNL